MATISASAHTGLVPQLHPTVRRTRLSSLIGPSGALLRVCTSSNFNIRVALTEIHLLPPPRCEGRPLGQWSRRFSCHWSLGIESENVPRGLVKLRLNVLVPSATRPLYQIRVPFWWLFRLLFHTVFHSTTCGLVLGVSSFCQQPHEFPLLSASSIRRLAFSICTTSNRIDIQIQHLHPPFFTNQPTCHLRQH